MQLLLLIQNHRIDGIGYFSDWFEVVENVNKILQEEWENYLDQHKPYVISMNW